LFFGVVLHCDLDETAVYTNVQVRNAGALSSMVTGMFRVCRKMNVGWVVVVVYNFKRNLPANEYYVDQNCHFA
jgi:hypothetical protein